MHKPYFIQLMCDISFNNNKNYDDQIRYLMFSISSNVHGLEYMPAASLTRGGSDNERII